MGIPQIKDKDRQVVFHAQRNRGAIHYLNPTIKKFKMSHLFKFLGIRILFRVGIIHAVHFRGFDHHIGIEMCLETPKGPDLKKDKENLTLLRSLIEG